MNLPNLLTLSRIGLTLVGLAMMALHPVEPPRGGWGIWTIFSLFLVAELTDYLDGRLARARGEVSAMGRMLDPLADKILIGGALILALRFHESMALLLPAWVVAVVVLREIVVTSLRGMVERRGEAFGADPFGKWKMGAQCVLVQALLAWQGGWEWCRPIAAVFVWISLGMTVLSGGNYLRKALAVFRG